MISSTCELMVAYVFVIQPYKSVHNFIFFNEHVSYFSILNFSSIYYHSFIWAFDLKVGNLTQNVTRQVGHLTIKETLVSGRFK